MAVEKNKTDLLIDDFQKTKKTGWIKFYKTQVRSCKNADEIIVPSKYLAGIVRAGAFLETKIKVIYNGVDLRVRILVKKKPRKNRNLWRYYFICRTSGTLEGFRMLIKIMPLAFQK